ncbi:MAG TPA: hypothetical protein DCE78_08380 [Bacteroidetes bacterium]|nr:hypothetical protein [Bacteroidota bacterium]
MKNNRALVLFLIIFAVSYPLEQLFAQDVTTVFFVRHAEKVDSSSDPELSEEGKTRVESLTAMLEKASIGAVYSTDYIRTRETCKPTAELHGVDLKLYDNNQRSQLNDMVNEYRGETILVCGHSNSVPRSANHLLGREVFEDFDEKDYGNIIIVTIPTTGEPTYTLLRY